MFTIYPPIGICEKGGRTNNEDSVYPPLGIISENSRLFMICDGVGGALSGEIASNMVAYLFPKYLELRKGVLFTTELINRILRYVENDLSEYKDEHPESFLMATTLTILQIARNECYVGWCGDSRVYHIRNKNILFRTKDHNLINKMLDNGEISPEQALYFPRKNVITRAITGIESPTKIEEKIITDLKIGDYFLLCSDGITEAITDSQLCSWFSESATPESIKEQILNSINNQGDNYSAIIIKIKSV